jgi:predicted nucleotidyltransferase
VSSPLPQPREAGPAGSRDEGLEAALLARVLERVLAWAGGRVGAVFISGSVGRGEGVWASTRQGPRLLSDLDLYVVLADTATRERTRREAVAGMPALLSEARGLGLWAPIDAGMVTPADLERIPARPGTLELRGARCLVGDARLLDCVPRYLPADIPLDETLLLLENRAHELLLAWAWLARGGEEGAWRAAHMSLKSALDLAGVLGLLVGRYPAGEAERVREATAALAEGGRLATCAPGLAPLWRRALEWRRRPAAPAGDAVGWWSEAVLAWTCVWLEATAHGRWAAEGDPYRRLRRVAARAPHRRRLRRALEAPPAGAAPAPAALGTRLLGAWRGTPQHRVNACAGALLFSAAEGERGRPALGPRAARALAALAPFAAPAGPEWEAWRARVVQCWDRWFLDGQRSREAP